MNRRKLVYKSILNSNVFFKLFSVYKKYEIKNNYKSYDSLELLYFSILQHNKENRFYYKPV